MSTTLAGAHPLIAAADSTSPRKTQGHVSASRRTAHETTQTLSPCLTEIPRTRGAFTRLLDGSASLTVALPPALYHTDAPVKLRHRSTFL